MRRIMFITIAATFLVGCGSKATTSTTPGSDAGPAGETTAVIATGGEETFAVETTVAPEETTFPAIETTVSAESSDTVATGRVARLVIRAKGLGEFDFGAPAEDVLASLTARFGEPDNDSGWGPDESPCSDGTNESRSVTWRQLSAMFTGGKTEFGTGRHFTAWFAVTPEADPLPGGLMPADGKPVIGETYASLKARFPNAERVESEIEGPVFSLRESPGSEGYDVNAIVGGLSEFSDNGVATSIRAGLVCID